MFSRKMNLSAWSLVPREEKMGGRIIQDGRKRLINPCRSFFEARALLVRALPLDQHGLEWDEKCIITVRLHCVVSPGCS